MKSYQYPAEVRDYSKTRGLAKYVLMVLATYTDDSGECFPSHNTLAHATGLSLRTIERVMKEIPADELQVVEKGKATGYPTKYRITVNSRQNDDSRDNNSRLADGSTPVKQSPNSRLSDGLTTKELPIELPKARKRAAGSDSASVVTIPSELDTPAFQKAWDEWLEYRKQIKKPLKALSQRKQLDEFKSWGPDRAIAAINHSMANGYQGVFKPAGYNSTTKTLRLDEFGHSKL